MAIITVFQAYGTVSFIMLQSILFYIKVYLYLCILCHGLFYIVIMYTIMPKLCCTEYIMVQIN